MGKLTNGIFGGFTGRVGNVVCYKLGNKDVIRTIGINSNAASKKMLTNYQKMTVTNAFLGAVVRFIDIGFELAAAEAGMNTYNKAISYNKINAMKGKYPNIELNYEKALVSMGNLPTAINAKVSKTKSGVEFTWENKEGLSDNYAADQVMLLICLPDEKNSAVKLSTVFRSAGRDSIKMSKKYMNQRMEAFIAFRSDDRKSISNSVYCGSL